MQIKATIHRRIRELIYAYAKRIRHNVTIVNFHQIAPEFDPERHLSCTFTSTSEFRSMLLRLRKQFTFISLAEAAEKLNRPLDRNYCVLTFDDGFADVLDHALPVLEELQITATLFINTGYLDDFAGSWVDALTLFQRPEDYPAEIVALTKTLRHETDPERYRVHRAVVEKYYAGLPDRPKKYLSWEQLRATAQSPLLTIGLHGHEHQRQSMMIDEWNRANLQTCYDLLSPLPNFVPFYALPFGRLEDWNLRALDDARALGLTLLTHNCGVNTTRTPILNRCPSDGGHPSLPTNYLH